MRAAPARTASFSVYESLAEYTRAAFLQDPTIETPVFVRFSTVLGSRGSADTARDVRGFATKFYTPRATSIWSATTFPSSSSRTRSSSPTSIHAAKPEPHNEMPQAATAHDTF